jgi:methylenetetrahydrofolate dehydrogenase (NADP+)/methenyltetrahydrofolate cyclohydrolase
LDVKVFYKKNNEFNLKFDNINNILSSVKKLNNDTNCIWIMFQLPLPKELQQYQPKILWSVNHFKDIDGLWWILVGLSAISLINFIPATPAAVLNILKYYNLDNFEWKKISVIGQSNLVWKPLAIQLIKLWAEVFSFNQFADQKHMKWICKESDYIISATWSLHLIDKTFLNKDGNQVLIDVGWGIKDWKAAWDIDFDDVKDKVKAITPVPWGVWPVTVASLFENIYNIRESWLNWF